MLANGCVSVNPGNSALVKLPRLSRTLGALSCNKNNNYGPTTIAASHARRQSESKPKPKFKHNSSNMHRHV